MDALFSLQESELISIIGFFIIESRWFLVVGRLSFPGRHFAMQTDSRGVYHAEPALPPLCESISNDQTKSKIYPQRSSKVSCLLAVVLRATVTSTCPCPWLWAAPTR